MIIPFDEITMHMVMEVPEDGILSKELLDKYCALYPEHSKAILEFACDWFMDSLLARAESTDEVTELTEQDLTIVNRWARQLQDRFEDVK
jgi:competence transcription factor ComK